MAVRVVWIQRSVPVATVWCGTAYSVRSWWTGGRRRRPRAWQGSSQVRGLAERGERDRELADEGGATSAESFRVPADRRIAGKSNI